MKPDDKYSEKQTQMETEKLKQKVKSLSVKDKQQIYEKGQALGHVLTTPGPPTRGLQEVSRGGIYSSCVYGVPIKFCCRCKRFHPSRVDPVLGKIPLSFSRKGRRTGEEEALLVWGIIPVLSVHRGCGLPS